MGRYKKNRGWERESERHSLSARHVRTGRKCLRASARLPENREDITFFTKSLKKFLEQKYGQKFKVRTFTQVSANPWIEVRVADWEHEKMPNDLRVAAVKLIGGEPTDWEDVNYGNIRSGSVTLHYNEWKTLSSKLSYIVESGID